MADAVINKQLKVLTEAGYVKLPKPTGTGGRAKAWVNLTPAGRRAFEGHLAMLQHLAGDVFQGVG